MTQPSEERFQNLKPENPFGFGSGISLLGFDYKPDLPLLTKIDHLCVTLELEIMEQENTVTL